jgi:hypothetical protein
MSPRVVELDDRPTQGAEELGKSEHTTAKWVYGFSEGSRHMRELLGGKGATSPR